MVLIFTTIWVFPGKQILRLRCVSFRHLFGKVLKSILVSRKKVWTGWEVGLQHRLNKAFSILYIELWREDCCLELSPPSLTLPPLPSQTNQPTLQLNSLMDLKCLREEGLTLRVAVLLSERTLWRGSLSALSKLSIFSEAGGINVSFPKWEGSGSTLQCPLKWMTSYLHIKHLPLLWLSSLTFSTRYIVSMLGFATFVFDMKQI